MNRNIGRNEPCFCGSGKKYKRCCMSSSDKIKECFGDQGGTIFHGELPKDCLTCDVFEKCHKVTVAVALQGINLDLSHLIQNGLEEGWLKSLNELSEKKK